MSAIWRIMDHWKWPRPKTWISPTAKNILVNKRNDTKIWRKQIMLKPKQLLITIYVNVCVKRVYPHKTNNNILFRYGKFRKVNFLYNDRICDDRIRHLNHIWSLIVLSTKVSNFCHPEIWNSTRTSLSRLRQNCRERAVGMVQVGMIHQTAAGHFNVLRITISRLMIRFRQTGMTNDRPRIGRPCVTSQRKDIHLRLIHLRNRMITAEDTARRTPGIANVWISGHTVRRRLRESGIRARRPVVEPILKQRHRTARLA